jgi:hypothetical protein
LTPPPEIRSTLAKPPFVLVIGLPFASNPKFGVQKLSLLAGNVVTSSSLKLARASSVTFAVKSVLGACRMVTEIAGEQKPTGTLKI